MISASRERRCSAERPQPTIACPRRASSSASARPSPLLTPVMSTVLGPAAAARAAAAAPPPGLGAVILSLAAPPPHASSGPPALVRGDARQGRSFSMFPAISAHGPRPVYRVPQRPTTTPSLFGCGWLCFFPSAATPAHTHAAVVCLGQRPRLFLEPSRSLAPPPPSPRARRRRLGSLFLSLPHPCLDSPAAVIPRLVSSSGYWIQWKSLPVLSRSLGILYSEYSTPRINMLCAVVICEILGSSCTKKRVIGKACYWKSVGMDGSLFLCQELSNLLVV